MNQTRADSKLSKAKVLSESARTHTGINDILECYFTGSLVGLLLLDAINSVNVVDGNFESNKGVGIIVSGGAMVRIEGNEFESQGGPGIVANNIRALTLRESSASRAEPSTPRRAAHELSRVCRLKLLRGK